MQVVKMKVSYFDTDGAGNAYVKWKAGECYPQTAETLTRVAAGTAELVDVPAAAAPAPAEDQPVAAAPAAPKTKTKPA